MTGADDRTEVRLTQDVGEIFGVDGEEYVLQDDAVVTLPTPNAEILLEKDAAVRVDDTDTGEDSGAALFMGGGGEDNPYEASYEEQEQRRREARTPEATGYARSASTLPLGQLDAICPAERRRAARKRGLDWPTTDEARDRLFDTIADVMRHGDDRVVDAPTALGKSGTIARTRWGAREDITDGKPVVHLSATRDARDEAIKAAQEWGGEHFVLQSRHEACPVAAGDYDPPSSNDVDRKDLDYEPITIRGVPASDWLRVIYDHRGLPFSAAHRHLEQHHDQGREHLPCCGEDGTGECWAIVQWDELREHDWPLVIATHQFAHVPGLRMGTHLVIDEEPDYMLDLGTAEVCLVVASYLRAVGAPVTTWESFIQLSRYEGYGDDASAEREALRDALNDEPDRDWYFESEKAHALAPALARAIFHAEERANGRRVGKTAYDPPRLDARAHEEDSWNREWVTVVLDESNDVRTIRTVPDMQLARSVVGLDAHPARPVWQANTLPHIQPTAVIESDERALWRRYERGLRVVQVGDATRPLASGEYFDYDGTKALLGHLRETYGEGFRTAITAKAVEGRTQDLLSLAGVDEPEMMHYGEEKSRNDFADESIGAVLGCLDPGDDYVLDLLAELDLEAEPERSEHDCDHCAGAGCPECDGTGAKRAHGREFVGADADTAAAILASVRENHTAQAAGRYARRPGDPESNATVFVRTDAAPSGFVDMRVPGVSWVYTDKQEAVIEALRESDEAVSARDLAGLTGVSKQHVYRTLERLVEDGNVDAHFDSGPHGATLYSDIGVLPDGTVDLGESLEITTDDVQGPYTWSVTISPPSQSVPSESREPGRGLAATASTQQGLAAFNGGDRPPDDRD